MKNTRWVILGTAHIADSVAAAIGRSPSNQVVAVASRSLDKARQWGEQRGIEHAYGSYQEMLDAGGFDVVYNPLPNALHAPWTIAALKAGFPVLCEKPIALNRDESREILEVSAETGLAVAEGFMYRFHPMFDAARKLIEQGAIGDVVTLNSRFSFFEDDRSSIVASAELGGGALMDVGCYCVNFARLMTQSEPLRVSASSLGDAVDDTMVGLLEFPGGVLSHFETSIASSEQHYAEVCGTNGSLVFPNPWVSDGSEAQVLVRRWGEQDKVLSIPGADTYRLEIEDFADAIGERRVPRWGLEDAIKNMAVIDALKASARTGRHVEVVNAAS